MRAFLGLSYNLAGQGHGAPLFALLLLRRTSFSCLSSRERTPTEYKKLRLQWLWDSCPKEWGMVSRARGIHRMQMVRQFRESRQQDKSHGPAYVTLWWEAYVCVWGAGNGRGKATIQESRPRKKKQVSFWELQKIKLSMHSGDRQLFSNAWENAYCLCWVSMDSISWCLNLPCPFQQRLWEWAHHLTASSLEQ